MFMRNYYLRFVKNFIHEKVKYYNRQKRRTVVTALEDQENQLVKQLAKQIAENELVIYCETCRVVFYAGTIEFYVKSAKKDSPRDFHVLAMRHVWNNQFHHITYNVPLVKTVNTAFMQYLPNLNLLVNELKTRTPENAVSRFEDLWTGKKPVRCSSCNNQYTGKLGWLNAAKCCLETKPFLSELP